MSTLKTNNIEHLDASTPSIQTTIGGGVVFAGLSTFQANAQFDGNVNIAGTVTYDDVTNIDSVGIITAQSGLNVGPKTGIACTISSVGNISGRSFNAFRTGQGYVYVSGSAVNGLSLYDTDNSTILSKLGWDGSITAAGNGLFSYSRTWNNDNAPGIRLDPYQNYATVAVKNPSSYSSAAYQVLSDGYGVSNVKVELNNDGSIKAAGDFSFTASDARTINAIETLKVNINSNGGVSNRVFEVLDNSSSLFTVGTAGLSYGYQTTDDGSSDFGINVIGSSGNLYQNVSNTSADGFVLRTLGSQKIQLKGDGAINATGAIDGYGIVSKGNSGTAINWTSYHIDGVTNPITSKILANGNAEFGTASNATNNNGILLGGSNGQINLYTTRYNNDCFQILNTSGSGTNVAVRFDGDGSADFAGAVKIGGTAAANQIDEYEEGTWTPTAGSSMAINSGTWAANGYYTKIGNVVTVEIKQTSGTVSWALGGLIIGGCPFTPAGSTGATGCLTNTGPNISMNVLQWSSGNIYAPEAATSQTTLRINMTFLV